MADGGSSLHRRRGPSTFRERDLTAAIKAARKAGAEHFIVEVAADGRLRVIVSSSPIEPEARHPWDDED